MKYALLIYGDHAPGSTCPRRRGRSSAQRRCRSGSRSSRSSARPIRTSTGKELDGRRTAKVVRVRDGERIVTDGPFAETKEIIGGFFLVDLPDLDEAIRLAALVPAAEHGSIEIRPILQ